MPRNNNRSITKWEPTAVGFFYGLFIFTFVAIVMNSQRYGWAEWYQLVVSGQKAQAVITKLSPIHDTCYFEYTVNSKQYKGADEGCNAEIGQIKTITFLPSDPTFGTSASPIEVLLTK